MKVIHLASSAGGGAGIAASRTVAALREHGVEAELWTADQTGEVSLRTDKRGKWRARLDRFPLRFYRKRKLFSVWSNNWVPSGLLSAVQRAAPDLIHLHLTGAGVMNPSELSQLRVPLVWSMHDTWAFTGGCHYPGDCSRYERGCGSCPQLGSAREEDLSRANFRRKTAFYPHVSAWIMPSHWMRDVAIASRAVATERIHVIPYALDLNVFSPGSRNTVRATLGLPSDALVLAVGATYTGEERKGFHLVAAALSGIAARQKCVVLQFGSGTAGDGLWPCPVKKLGLCRTEREMADLYRAADVFLLPSLQDNLPNVALEALACGCPIVGFVPSGLSDIIEDNLTGKITADRSVLGLAKALEAWLAIAPARAESLRRCRMAAEEKYSFEVHASVMTSLYHELLGQPNRRRVESDQTLLNLG